jgi:DNA-directed RNA polymerase specialized sigma24 family protein
VGEPSESPTLTILLDGTKDSAQRVESEAAAVVRLRFFAGLSVEQTAEALDVSTSTVDRRWAFARARLYETLRADTAS